MKTIKIRRLWHGMASVRDYIVDEARSGLKDITIEYAGEKMTIPTDKLYEGYLNSKVFTSKHGGKYKQYRLVDFKWIPDGPKQLKLV